MNRLRQEKEVFLEFADDINLYEKCVSERLQKIPEEARKEYNLYFINTLKDQVAQENKIRNSSYQTQRKNIENTYQQIQNAKTTKIKNAFQPIINKGTKANVILKKMFFRKSMGRFF